MNRFFLCLFLLCGLAGLAQDTSLRTYAGMPVDSNTCIFRIKLIDLISKDGLHSEARKPRVEKLVSYLRSCDPRFTFDSAFEDREIRLLVPKYLSKVSYELGDQQFGIVLSDSSHNRFILFSYDLDDRYKKHFLTHDNMGFQKTGTVQTKKGKIYRFINWDKRFAGTLFTSNHLHVSYFTSSKKYERELQETISKFSW